MKTCARCQEEKPKITFHKDRTKADGLRYICAVCTKAVWRETHPQLPKRERKVVQPKPRKPKRAYNKSEQSRARRNRQYIAKYGIRIEDYDRMYENQQGKCVICRIQRGPEDPHLCVDHCHATGKVRGLLCLACNTALGSFKDNPLLMERAIAYLSTASSEKPSEPS